MAHRGGMQGRKREAWAKWQELVAEQAGSGLSVAAFCRERRLTESQLFTWKRRLREAAVPSFVELQVVGAVAPACFSQPSVMPGRAIEIRLEGGRRVFVEPGFEAEHLRAVVEALDARV